MNDGTSNSDSESSPIVRKKVFGPAKDMEYLRTTYNSILKNTASVRDINPTGPGATLMHILKANIGIGMLSMPNAIQNAGYVLGPILLILMGIIATHCMTLIVTASHHLCALFELPALSYADVAQLSIAYKSKRPWLGQMARILVNLMLLLTQLGFCCTYIAFVAKNVILLIENSGSIPFQYRLIIVMILPIFLLGSYIRSLKYLAPFSTAGNFCYLYSIIVILAYCLTIVLKNGLGPGVQAFSTTPLTYPLFFGNVIFAFEGIGCILPQENKMSNPNLFVPILWIGMVLVITSFVILGVFGYFAFGSNLAEVISLNLPERVMSPIDLVYTVAIVYLTFGIFSSYLVQFYVPIEIIEPIFIRRIQSPKLKILVQYIIRTILVTFTALIPIVIGQIDLLIDLIGACSSTCIALIFPAVIEIVSFWRVRRYCLPFYLWVIKDIIILSIGLIGGVLGTGVAMYNIVLKF
ncbi:Proton-coupled amino acid transporter 1 [Oopsacas minuta]|uniref:Proton-coupled amino acid transporter 1 n=1 Tax=Oopsacas minuta TaxID=111878 RepID=A0AAV7JEY0_9METZ|nr:Proton-coupled amino acid transporter 1 [Oopsacas minuta]